ncbi:MlaD family protein [Rubellimicrobium aerolatum]|uniref:MlaD family protein n=1 Tax=Rubellimicrobium aerolatum TaxID=490979 RepID=A0ABW0SFD1_9RHOB|nr:MlaD family protein [Rubellimicrobium aerolatum]MBP1805611.1 paraquat-inducible protein B [Rubellimicrobium aerolatum]
MTDPIPPIPVASARRSLWQRVSVIWLVPLAALAIALGVAWSSFREQGPLIEIEFEDAAGVVARQTELRYRNVAVGLVERVRFTPDLARVIVSVRLDREVAPFVDADARFWVVRPEITTQRITGLETVLSGVFIEGTWDNARSEPAERFQGLATTPLLGVGQEGLEFTLRSTDGTLTSAVPIIYQGVTVGQVGDPVVGTDGISVTAPAVIFAPYDRLVTEATVFWDASGFSLSVGSGGAEVDFDSLSSLIVGGLAFDTFVSGAQPARDGDVFEAFLYESYARDSIYTDPNSPVLSLLAIFSGDIAGLAVGAPVELDGLRIGEVTDVNGLLDPERFGDEEVHLQAVLALQPARLGLEGDAGREEVLDALQARVARGLRAQLASAGLLGGLKVQLLELPDLPPGEIDLAALPFPALPTAEAQIADVAGQAQDVLTRVSNLPIEDLLDSATAFLDNAATLVGSPETQAVPGQINGLLGDLRNVTASPEVQALPGQLSQTLADIDATINGIRESLDSLREQNAIGRILAAVDTANTAVARIGEATAGVPALIDNLNAVAAKAQALPVEDLLAEVSGLSADARALLAQPGVQELPAQLGQLSTEATATLSEARAILSDLDDGELGTRLASAIAAADQAAQSVQSAADDLPQLTRRIDALVAKANALPVGELVAELTALSASADALVGSEGAQQLPADLSAALAEVEALLREAREGGVIANANATLAAARDAATSLPALVERASALLDQATATVAGFDSSSGVVREAQAAIREVAAAADAVAALARTIERNPNSLIFGRD